MLVAMIIVKDVHSTELLKKETGAAQRGALGWISSGNSAELEFHLPAFPFMHSSLCEGPQETFCLKVGRRKHSGSHLLGALRSVPGTRRHCRSHWQDLPALRAGWGCPPGPWGLQLLPGPPSAPLVPGHEEGCQLLLQDSLMVKLEAGRR